MGKLWDNTLGLFGDYSYWFRSLYKATHLPFPQFFIICISIVSALYWVLCLCLTLIDAVTRHFVIGFQIRPVAPKTSFYWGNTHGKGVDGGPPTHLAQPLYILANVQGKHDAHRHAKAGPNQKGNLCKLGLCCSSMGCPTLLYHTYWILIKRAQP